MKPDDATWPDDCPTVLGTTSPREPQPIDDYWRETKDYLGQGPPDSPPVQIAITPWQQGILQGLGNQQIGLLSGRLADDTYERIRELMRWRQDAHHWWKPLPPDGKP